MNTDYAMTILSLVLLLLLLIVLIFLIYEESIWGAISLGIATLIPIVAIIFITKDHIQIK